MRTVLKGVNSKSYPINPYRGRKQHKDYNEILYAKAELGKYLMEKCYSEHFQNLSFKIFAKSFLIPISGKGIKDLDDNLRINF